jgi:RND family efflux transporter MFP subunit
VRTRPSTRRLSFCHHVLSNLADIFAKRRIETGAALLALSAMLLVVPVGALAAPFSASVGGAQATLQLTPDPPRIGKAHAVVTLSGVSPQVLAVTTASFATAMPSMGMGGPNGVAKPTGTGRYEFDAMLAMAAVWDIDVKFSGGVSGTAVFHVTVGTGSAPPSGAPSASTRGSASNASSGTSATSAMTGMSSSGDPGAWRTATFALAAIFVIGLLAVLLVRRERRPLTIGIAVAGTVVILGLAVAQARYASPPMDMNAMASVQGDAPTPVTLATVAAADGRADVFAPGTIAPYLTQDIVTRAAGIVRNFSTYAGDRVRTGEVIATLDAPDLQSQAVAAAADADAQTAAAQAAEIEARHHAPNGVVIANAETAATERDLSAARSDRTAKDAQLRYWEDEIRRERTLLEQGAVSQQEYQDELAQAAAARAAHDSAAQRVGSLEQQLVASRTKAEDAVASVAQMQAQAASARAQALRAQANARTQSTLAGYTTVTSPSNAIVVKRLVDPGVYVQTGTAIARVAVVNRLRLQANVAQRDLPGTTVGTPVDATLSDGTVVHGRVTSVSPVADPSTHTAVVEAVVGNTRTDLVPGGYARVMLHPHARVAPGVRVPSSAIVGSGADAAVWTNVNDAAHRVSVTVISDNGTTAVVRGALQRGVRVVVEGAPTLEEDQALTERGS